MIDNIHFELTLNSINDTRSIPETHPGEIGIATLTTSYRVYCDDNYYGPNCEVYCQMTYNSTGLYQCDEQGNLLSTILTGKY